MVRLGRWYAQWGRGPADGVPTAVGAGQVNRACIKTKEEQAAFRSMYSVVVMSVQRQKSIHDQAIAIHLLKSMLDYGFSSASYTRT